MPEKPKEQGKTEQPGEPVLHTLSLEAMRLLDTAADIRENPDATDIAYMARQLVQCTLPHKDPGDARVWRRTNGAFTLKIRPDVDEKGRNLYPYGSIPRLLLFWIVGEATKSKLQTNPPSRKIHLGNSLYGFMRNIGLSVNTGGGKRGNANRLQGQMERLFRAVISFEDTRPTHKAWIDMQIAPKAMLWWDPKKPQQDNLFESWITLGEDFYEAITAAPVPMDYRALRALKKSPLALDLYAWATYTTFSTTKRGQQRTVSWDALHAQMGAEYAEVRRFRQSVIAALKKIQVVYPDFKCKLTPEGVTVYPSLPAIAAKP